MVGHWLAETLDLRVGVVFSGGISLEFLHVVVVRWWRHIHEIIERRSFEASPCIIFNPQISKMIGFCLLVHIEWGRGWIITWLLDSAEKGNAFRQWLIEVLVINDTIS